MLPPPSPSQARIVWFALTALAASVVIALAVGVLWGLAEALRLLAPVVWPLAVAGVLAYLLDPVVDFLVARSIPRARAIVLVFLIALGAIVGVFAAVVPQLYGEARQFADRVPAYATKLQQRVDVWATNPPTVVRRVLKLRAAVMRSTNSPADLSPTNAVPVDSPAADTPRSGTASGTATPGFSRDAVRSATAAVANALPEIGSWVFGKVSQVKSWLGLLAGVFLVPVYAFYFLLEKRGIERRWTDYLPVRTSRFKDELVFCLRAVNDYLIVFFRSQVLVALCDGVLYTTGFLIIGLPYAFLLGLMATALTMIPFLGAMTTCATALVIAVATSGDWHLPVAVLAVFGVVQAIEGLVISPRIMGGRVGLHPLTIIIAVMTGTSLLGGLLGGVLAIPLTAAARVIMFRYVWRRPEAAGTEEAEEPAGGAKG